MRVRTKSACVVLAWGTLLLLAAAGSSGSPRPAQANNRIATSTSTISTTTRIIIHATLTSAQTSTLTSSPAARPDAARSGLAAPRATRSGGGYVVQPGDTLSGIAAALGIRGGWPALYAANRHAIGPNPDVIRPGVVLTIPQSAAAPASVSRPPHPARRPSPPPATAPAPDRTPATAPAPTRSPTSAKASAKAKSTVSAKAPTAGGLPRWLQIVLLAAGILIGAAFLANPPWRSPAVDGTPARMLARMPCRPPARPPARPPKGGSCWRTTTGWW